MVVVSYLDEGGKKQARTLSEKEIREFGLVESPFTVDQVIELLVQGRDLIHVQNSFEGVPIRKDRDNMTWFGSQAQCILYNW